MSDWNEKLVALIGGSVVFIVFVVLESSFHPVYATFINQIPSKSFQTLMWTVITLGSIISAVGILIWIWNGASK